MLGSLQDLERNAESFRQQLGLGIEDPLDPLRLKISGVGIVTVDQIHGVTEPMRHHLSKVAYDQWSAMSVPLDEEHSRWLIVVNHAHDPKRQRASVAEELWHIFQGDELTEIVKIGPVYGRNFKKDEEESAFYLAAASLLPQTVIKELVDSGGAVEKFAEKYGVSNELVEYRIKRLGLWNRYKGRDIKLES